MSTPHMYMNIKVYTLKIPKFIFSKIVFYHYLLVTKENFLFLSPILFCQMAFHIYIELGNHRIYFGQHHKQLR